MRMRCKGLGADSAHKMFLLATMYFCQAIPMGYVFGTLPVAMREDGVSLARIGGLFVLHLPWAFKFLYASRVDKYYLPSLGRRRTWIFPLQWVMAGLLLLVSQTPPDVSFNAMFAVLMALNIVIATNDIAVDGYATDMLEDRERAWGNTIQAGARYVGLFLGGGLMLFLHRSLGWQFLCISLAATVLLLSLPVFLHREIPPVRVRDEDDADPGFGVRAFLRKPDVLWLLPVLIAPTAFAFSAYQMRTPLFVDLGLGSPTLGKLTMQFAVPLGVAGTVATAWIMNRFGSRAFMRLFCILSAALSAFAVHLSVTGSVSALQAGIILCLDNILIGGVNVWGFTLMMRASAGKYAGTGFAVLSSLYILFPLAAAPLMGWLGDRFGFTFLYSMLTACILAGFLVAEATLKLAPGKTDAKTMPETFGTELQGELK
ncbi:MAG: MFS transporter [Pseudodesulfovibrio sp.]